MAEQQNDESHVLKEGAVVGIGGILGALFHKYTQKKYDEATDDTYRKSFVVIVSQMEEPERSRFNAHHRKAQQEGIENKFVRLLTKAVEGQPTREQRDYFTYVAMLNWNTEYRDDQGFVQPSVQQELDSTLAT